MSRRVARLIPFVLLASVLAVPTVVRAEADRAEVIRKAILKLPYYGPFDLISFEESNGVVTLGGAVYIQLLKAEAEESVRAIPGVRDVVNRIEVLPVSFEDDRLRRAVFARIYTDEFLAKYGTPVGLLGGRPWGRGFRAWGGFAGGRWSKAPFFGLEPAGRYAIHVIVRAGRVTLYGAVDDATDRDKAALDARGVIGVFGVDNEIVVRAKPGAPPT